MQKELKLLLSDAPPGASFPGLSADLSLSSIDAQIKGPEGTVCADGVFTVKIQIPERYPFQPPIVTFALLSEPNPDDGLMCEASREYKYNRQAFDQEARSMTEKYAHPGASGNVGSSGCIQAYSNTIMVEVKKTENDHEANEYILNCKKICGTSRKLKLQSSGSPERRVESDKGNGASNNLLSVKETENQMEVEETKKELKHTIHKSKSSQQKLKGNGRKLSLASFALSQKKNDTENKKLVPKNILSPISKNLSVFSLGSPDYHMEEINQREDSM